jgi:hypothetical protein
MPDQQKKTHRNQQLATALRHLKQASKKTPGTIMAQDLDALDKAILLEAGFLQPVIKGWYVCSNPADIPGDSTSWYASFWCFVEGYLKRRFGDGYCLSPEASLLLHTGNTVIPRQLVVVTAAHGTDVVGLPFDTSLMIYPDPKRLPQEASDSTTVLDGLRVWSVAAALCRSGPQLFKSQRREAEIALAMVRDVSTLISVLTALANPTAAARMAGALEFVGRKTEAQILIKALSAPGQKLYAKNPFEALTPTLIGSRDQSPYVLRLRAMWRDWREVVIENFPSAPGVPANTTDFLKNVDERYAYDAYNSLSIEGYNVTDELIERVARGNWNPDNDAQYQKDCDTLAARGYFQAFGTVKQTISDIFGGERLSDAVRFGHQLWYSALFSSAVSAGILAPNQIAGYRSGPIFIRNSLHTPLPRDAILDSLDELWRLIDQEPEACVSAVLGHHLFVFIHPYFDGNGRIGRFLMNTLLASGGYPWTIVRVSRRTTYMNALESASVDGDIKPLTVFLKEEMLQLPSA